MLEDNLEAKKVYSFGLMNSYYGIVTMEDITEMCRECGTEIYKLELANLADILDWIHMIGEPFGEYLQVKEGIYKWIDLTFIASYDFYEYAKVS
ncbi:hypothetical protein [Clostridium sp. UBA6640]|uniref:hypothetical protein n=1 Tax=Clostridium sp. UBA6640 TaxID=1946370 RepID=UPI0025BEC0C5|nr:hypothetical protein [Clostridium sp. UBA6640]